MRGSLRSWLSLSLAGLALFCSCTGTIPDAPTSPALAETPASASARPPEDQRLDDLLEPIRAAHKLPALAAAVIRGGKLVAQGAVGVRAVDAPAPVTLDDRWHIGSDTKAMTATLAAVLVARGQIRWDSTVGESLAELSPAPGWQKVTLENLLAHTGGAPAKLSHDQLNHLRALGTDVSAGRQWLAQQVLATPPSGDPGHSFVYSNAGYMLAGLMMERATGRSWEDLMRADLFTPLHMNSAGFGPPLGKDQPRAHVKQADGTWRSLEPTPLADNPASLGPAGTVHVSLADWARFAALHIHAARGEPTAILDPQTLSWLHRPRTDSYALGWGVVQRDWAQGTALTHSGSNTMWFATAWLAPQIDLGVLVVTNAGTDQAAQATDQAVGAILRQLGLLADSSDPR